MAAAFQIEFTPEAVDDLRLFRKAQKKRIIEEIEVQLVHEPMRETSNRKRLRPNRIAEWELRIDDFRVFYDVDSETKRVNRSSGIQATQ